VKEVKGNIWNYYNKGCWIVITTNGTVKNNGEAVMGRGVALQAKNRFPELPKILGDLLKKYGNQVYYITTIHIFTFPVKHNWYEKADLDLIEKSCRELGRSNCPGIEPYYMVRPGCGNGGLDWKNVKPILEKYLDDRFTIVEIGDR